MGKIDIHRNKPKINMLMDIENIFGESTRGFGIAIVNLIVVLIPPLIIGYFMLYLYIPIWILIVFCLLWAIRVTFFISGREPQRMSAFKKQKENKFVKPKDIMRIRTIHQNGCVEYINGEVMYIVEAYNNTPVDTLQKSREYDQFLSILVGKNAFEVYVQNINDTDAINESYKNISRFEDTEAARQFTAILDHVKDIVSKNSTMLRLVFVVRASKYKWKELQREMEIAVNSSSAAMFKRIKLVTNRDEIESIISRDVNGNLPIDNMLRQAYSTGSDRGAYIISYDYKDIKDNKEVKKIRGKDPGFMPVWKGEETK